MKNKLAVGMTVYAKNPFNICEGWDCLTIGCGYKITNLDSDVFYVVDDDGDDLDIPIDEFDQYFTTEQPDEHIHLRVAPNAVATFNTPNPSPETLEMVKHLANAADKKFNRPLHETCEHEYGAVKELSTGKWRNCIKCPHWEKVDEAFTTEHPEGGEIEKELFGNGQELSNELLVAQLQSRVQELEGSTMELIDERDHLEDALNKIMGIMKIDKEWSNHYNVENFVDDVLETVNEKDQQITQLTAEVERLRGADYLGNILLEFANDLTEASKQHIATNAVIKNIIDKYCIPTHQTDK